MHRIEGWEEFQGDTLTARATRPHRQVVDYWNRNRNSDADWRQRLGLPDGGL